jgi:hypothetical protein
MLDRIAALRTLVCLLLLGAGTLLHAQSPMLTSGFYGDHRLQIVVAPDGTFSGSFFDETGAGKFTCTFLVHGDGQHSKRGGYRVVTWWPTTQLDGGKNDEVVVGALRVSAKGIELQLPKSAHDACGNVNHDLDAGNPVELRRGQQHPLWRELRVVLSKQVVLLQQPDTTVETGATMEQGDLVTVLSTRGPWQHIEFYSYTAGRTFSGWVKDADLLPFNVPEYH